MLYRIFNDVVQKKELRVDKVRAGFKSVSRDIFTVDDKMDYMLDLLNLYGSISFHAILCECTSKTEIIVTFLAMLELLKTNGVTAAQEQAFDDIMIKRTIVGII
jgi:segregation and condensation protein A